MWFTARKPNRKKFCKIRNLVRFWRNMGTSHTFLAKSFKKPATQSQRLLLILFILLSMVEHIWRKQLDLIFHDSVFKTYVTALASFCCCTATVSIQLPSLHKKIHKNRFNKIKLWLNLRNHFSFRNSTGCINGNASYRCPNQAITKSKIFSTQKTVIPRVAFKTKWLSRRMNETPPVKRDSFIKLFERVCRLTARKPMWYERCS